MSAPSMPAVRRAAAPWWLAPSVGLGVAVAAVALGVAHGPVVPLHGLAQSWAAIAIAVVFQALPFLVLGVCVSGAISAFAPEAAIRRVTPRSPFVAVPVFVGGGFFLPGCECGAVPVAQTLARRGVPAAGVVAFMLASPAINPVVLVSTAVAFSRQPAVVWARLAASGGAAVAVGWLWVIIGNPFPGEEDAGASGCCAAPGVDHSAAPRLSVAQRWEAFRAVAVHDLMNAGGYLCMGALCVALIKVAVPGSWLSAVGDSPWGGCVLMAVLAVVLALCSEADAFIAASFTLVSPTAQLVFMVVGPMVDVKLAAMQYGAWGGRFVRVFVPVTAVVAVCSAVVVGVAVFGGV